MNIDSVNKLHLFSAVSVNSRSIFSTLSMSDQTIFGKKEFLTTSLSVMFDQSFPLEKLKMPTEPIFQAFLLTNFRQENERDQ